MAQPNDAEGASSTVRVAVGGEAPPGEGRPPGDAAGEGNPLRRDAGQQLLDAARDAADGVDVREVGSAGARALDPLVLLTHGGTTAYHPRPSVERVRGLVEELPSGDVGADDAAWVVDYDPEATDLPTPNDGPLAVGRRRVLGRCGWAAPGSAAAAEGGAATLARDDRETARDRVRRVGLLGRGRGDASQDDPVADGWGTVRETPGDPVVVVNANDSDRRNGTDRTLLGGAPAEVLDGAFAVAELVGADLGDVIVYTGEGDDLVRRRTRAAGRTVADALDVDAPTMASGPRRFIAGEFTMALEALEGNDRLEARLRPPGPASHGVYGRPTVVHTPRTYAQVRAAMLDPDRFDADDADPGTRLVSVAGDVADAATVELPTGGSLGAVRDAVAMDGRFKMACVGGQFGGFTRSLDHVPSAPALKSADLGTEGVVELFDDGHCAVATAGERARFASEENCGRCFPCREGSKQAVGLLRDVYDGTYEDDMLRELTRVMGESSICHFGQSAARSVGTALARFETEFKAHADGRCPSGACEMT